MTEEAIQVQVPEPEYGYQMCPMCKGTGISVFTHRWCMMCRGERVIVIRM
jgi:DnaJ-class molecular chaperone